MEKLWSSCETRLNAGLKNLPDTFFTVGYVCVVSAASIFLHPTQTVPTDVDITDVSDHMTTFGASSF